MTLAARPNFCSASSAHRGCQSDPVTARTPSASPMKRWRSSTPRRGSEMAPVCYRCGVYSYPGGWGVLKVGSMVSYRWCPVCLARALFPGRMDHDEPSVSADERIATALEQICLLYTSDAANE